MKSISKLRKEVLRFHLIKEIKENRENLYELSKQSIKLDPEIQYQVDNANCELEIGLQNDPTQIPLQIKVLMENISLLQNKLNTIERNILKSN